MKALITGASGFLGSHFIQYLKKSKIDFRTLSIRKSNADFLISSCYDTKGVLKALQSFPPDLIVHFAGVTKRDSLEDLYSVNIDFAQTLLHTLMTAGLESKVILIGSSAEYGRYTPSQLPLKESFIGEPLSHYGTSKFEQTRLGLWYRKQGLNITTARIFNPVGPGQSTRFFFSKIVNHLSELRLKQNLEPLNLGFLGGKRDFFDVRKLPRVLLDLYHSNTPGVVNICSGQPTKLEDVVAIAKELVPQFQYTCARTPYPDEVLDNFGDNSLIQKISDIDLTLNTHSLVQELVFGDAQ